MLLKIRNRHKTLLRFDVILRDFPFFKSPETFSAISFGQHPKRNETMEVDSGTPADQEAMLPRGPHPDDAFRDDDSSSFGSAASQHDDASLDDDAAMPAHALPHQSRHAMPATAASDVAADDASDEDDEEEAECRVCRGPAEEG